MSVNLSPQSWGAWLLWAFVAAVLALLVWSWIAGRRRRPEAGGRTEGTMKVTDPVCEMDFAPQRAAARVEYRGRTYYFCTQACRRQFEQRPEKYADAAGTAESAAHGADE